MGYTNSPLVSYTKLSPNNSGTRTENICFFTPHCYVGQASVEDAGTWFAQTETQASCNYMIGKDGRVALIVPESQRSWCSSSKWNDQRAVTVECASNKTHPYAFNTTVYMKLIELATDVCRRNGKKKLLWFADKAKTMAYTPAADEMVITVHRWYANKACPGDWLYSRLGDVAMKVTTALQKDSASSETPSNSATTQPSSSTQAKTIHAMADEKAKAAVMLELVHKCDKSGILNSVTAAQMILESGYCGTDLALGANNCFGMKCTLSNNTWSSVWDGKSKYTKRTEEQTASGKVYYVTADFRKYPCVEDSIKDHAGYLLGAMNGSKKRYEGLTSAPDYRTAITIIKKGGYATDVKYVDKVCSIIERFGLDKYDGQTSGSGTAPATKAVTYTVQAGAFSEKKNAKAMLKKVQKLGIDCFIKQSGKYYLVQCGAFSVKANADKIMQKLQAAGIDSFIKEI